jgi:hypothetical protein
MVYPFRIELLKVAGRNPGDNILMKTPFTCLTITLLINQAPIFKQVPISRAASQKMGETPKWEILSDKMRPSLY